MKGFKWLLFIAIAIAIFYYVGGEEEKKTITQAPTSQTQQTAGVETKALTPGPTSLQYYMADHMLPTWPQTSQGSDTGTLSDVLTRKNYVLILDGSGSMNNKGCSGNRTKNEVAKETVMEWAGLVPEDANLGLVVFDRNGFSIRLPLGTKNRAQFRAEVGKVVAHDKTPLTLALETAYQMLTEQGSRQLGYGDYTVVIVTDGIANDINALERSVDKVLTTSPILIHTIGFCIADNHSLNRKGRTIYKAAGNQAELRQGLQDVLAESESFDISGF